LAGEDPAGAEIENLRGKLERFGESIERDFLQEKLLIEELNELVELRARKKAVEAMLSRLQSAVQGRPAGGGGE
jgi:hypothetical protein